MIIRFNSTVMNRFEAKNFSALVGMVGLYFISLDELFIPYPYKKSKLIYIGMSESRANSIGNRLRDHISGRSKNTGITGYAQKWKMSFTYLDYEFLKQIFNCKIEFIETYFLENFAGNFGVYPICNNRRGGVESNEKFNSYPEIDWLFFGGE